MKLEQFHMVLSSIKNMQVKKMALSGGEPFLYPQISEILKLAYASGVETTIMSNGLFIDDEYVEKLLKYKFHLQLSLDGADVYSDDNIRGQGHFEKCIWIMGELYKRDYKYGYVRMTITKKNLDQYGKIFELGKKYQFVPMFSFVKRIGRASEHWERYGIEEKNKRQISEELCKLYIENKDWIIKIIGKKEYNILTRFYIDTCNFMKKKIILTPLIKVNGDVQLCQRLYGTEFSLGNIYNEPLDAILNLNNRKMIEILDIVKMRCDRLTENVCKRCMLNYNCNKGCLADSIDKGDIFSKPDDCEIRKDVFLSKIAYMINR